MPRGKERKRDRHEEMKTPYEKLKSLPYANQYLKPGITVEQLNAQAARMSDNDVAMALNRARRKLSQASLPQSRNRHERNRQGKTSMDQPDRGRTGLVTQIRRPSFRLISRLENTVGLGVQ